MKKIIAFLTILSISAFASIIESGAIYCCDVNKNITTYSDRTITYNDFNKIIFYANNTKYILFASPAVVNVTNFCRIDKDKFDNECK